MKKSRKSELQLLCCLVYFISYVTRIDYAAVLAELVNDLNITKQVASIAVTGSFITYGVGQVISGILGDKIRPTRLILIGLVCTSLINVSMPLLPGITAMTVIWCFNGFFQSMLWPPLVRLMAQNMTPDEYSSSVVSVSAACSVATIAVYLLAPIAISVSGWRLVFLIAGGFGLAISAVWFFRARGLREGAVTASTAGNTPVQTGGLSAVAPLLLPIMIAITLHGILRDGITTWMPTYIYEVFDMGVSMSILTTAILPIFCIVSINIASSVEKKLCNPLKTAGLLFALAFASSALMIPFFSTSVLFCALMMSVITGCMHGINLMLISHLPVHFSAYGKISTVSGLLNASTYIGSALSTYGFAALSDRFGWSFTISSWAVIAFGGMAICLGLIRKWKAFCKK